jgi:pimeloyl-ACP methyl ester carboxylesterase
MIVRLFVVLSLQSTFALGADELPALTEIKITSSIDGTKQPSLLWAPESTKAKQAPLLVLLHTWSGSYKQNNSAWQAEAVKRGWIYLHPNFRGPNNRPEACGSKLARQDILDAIDHVIANYKVDESRVYLAGASGGGHMTMLMAGYYPERFSAASAWVGISDLAEWYRFHTKDGKPGNYAQMTSNSCGGAPGESKKIDSEYKARSPIFNLHRVGDLPIELCAGVKDGKTGSVPIQHSLNAFNVIVKANSHSRIPQSEIDELWEKGRLSKPGEDDQGRDKRYGREIFLRRNAGPARITIFDGGHEDIPPAGISWLEKHQRKTRKTDARRHNSTSQ